MIERLSTMLGVDPVELSGTTIDAEIPLTSGLINRKIADYLARSNGKVAAAVVEPLAGDAFHVRVRLNSSLLPPVPIRLEIAAQPEWPATPVIVLRWSIAGSLGVLARAASPMVAIFSSLPPGIRVDKDLVGIDIAELLRSRGAGWAVPLVKRLRVHTSESGLRLNVGLGL